MNITIIVNEGGRPRRHDPTGHGPTDHGHRDHGHRDYGRHAETRPHRTGRPAAEGRVIGRVVEMPDGRIRVVRRGERGAEPGHFCGRRPGWAEGDRPTPPAGDDREARRARRRFVRRVIRAIEAAEAEDA